MAYPIRWRTLMSALAVFLLATTLGQAQQAQPAAQRPQQPAPGTHPLDPEIERGRTRMAAMQREIRDYNCIFTKRERVDGELLDHEQMYMRVRHEPFSVYMYFVGPEEKKGQQVVYIAGRNKGKMIAQPVGLKGIGGPWHIDPNGRLAMDGQRYPITTVGFINLTSQLIGEGLRDRAFPQCKVRYYKGAKVEDRVCTVTEITHPQMKQFDYSMARIFVDDEWNIPIRFESYLWPEKPGGEQQLLEEYTYTQLKFNNDYTDADFVIRKVK